MLAGGPGFNVVGLFGFLDSVVKVLSACQAV
jgi:hypothetical protein